jgi:hypothetical protein
MAWSADELHVLAVGSFVGSVKDVDLDLAIFDDGEAVGPNEPGAVRAENFVVLRVLCG